MTKDETGAVSTANALKMAIEALQNNQTYDWKGNPLTALDEANEKVINACKEALASYSEALGQPAQEYNINEMIDKITPENLQEPVAYADYERGTCYLIGTPIPKDEIANPLYTRPAQNGSSPLGATTLRTPLSDDEIKQCATKLGYMWTPEKYLTFAMDTILMQFARAIEQAHGIV